MRQPNIFYRNERVFRKKSPNIPKLLGTWVYRFFDDFFKKILLEPILQYSDVLIDNLLSKISTI